MKTEPDFADVPKVKRLYPDSVIDELWRIPRPRRKRRPWLRKEIRKWAALCHDLIGDDHANPGTVIKQLDAIAKHADRLYRVLDRLHDDTEPRLRWGIREAKRSRVMITVINPLNDSIDAEERSDAAANEAAERIVSIGPDIDLLAEGAREAKRLFEEIKPGPQKSSKSVATRRSAVYDLALIWRGLTGVRPGRRVANTGAFGEAKEYGPFRDFVIAALKPMFGDDAARGIDADIRAAVRAMGKSRMKLRN